MSDEILGTIPNGSLIRDGHGRMALRFQGPVDAGDLLAWFLTEGRALFDRNCPTLAAKIPLVKVNASNRPDLTPSLIADRLCPEAAGPIIRQIIEAAAEKAIEVTPPGRYPAMQASLVERNVCLAARIALQRQSERLENLLLALKDDEEDEDESNAPGRIGWMGTRTGEEP